MLSNATASGASDTAHLEEGEGLSAICAGTSGEASDPCMGFLRGTLHGLTAIGDYPFFCLPDPVPFGTVRDVVVTFMAKNQKALRRDSASVIRAALAEAYPCPPDHLFPQNPSDRTARGK